MIDINNDRKDKSRTVNSMTERLFSYQPLNFAITFL